MDETQLIKGILEGCILSIISKGETYGYEILQQLNAAGFSNLVEGTIYMSLSRLEKKGYITCRKQKSPLGPMRKYYSLTLEGTKYLELFKITYKQIISATDKVLEG